MLIVFALLAAAGTFAQSWSGALVDGKCFESRARNVNPRDTMTEVDRDWYWDIRYCHPTSRTKSFDLVQRVGPTLKLDTGATDKAGQIYRQMGKRDLYVIDVSGKLDKNTIKVDSISPAR